MTRRSERIIHEIPDELRSDRGDEDATAREMMEAFGPEIEELVAHHESGETNTVAVQGEISSMKTWLMTAAAKTLLERGDSVLILVPHKVNRSDVTSRLEKFGVPYIERPSRLDLCAWDEWRDSAGYVAESVCSNNGCSRYPDDGDMDRLARRAISLYLTHHGAPKQIDRDVAMNLAKRLDRPVCPFYLLEGVADQVPAGEAVRVATTAKAFKDESADRLKPADIVLLDEAHTVAADTERLIQEVNLPSITEAIKRTTECFASARKEDTEIVADLQALHGALDELIDGSPTQLDSLLRDDQPDLNQWFGVANSASEALVAKANREANAGRWSAVEKLVAARQHFAEVRGFLAEVAAWKDGDRDFVEMAYETQGAQVQRTYFRQVSDRQPFSTTDEVYESWQGEGTRPEIADRWGDLLGQKLPSVWEGRHVDPGGNRPVAKPVPRPLDVLRTITEAATVVGFSATHNEASDPARPANQPRSTRHRVLTAPLQLRSDGDDRPDYHGSTRVDPVTLWFRALLEGAKEQTDAALAAVPINTRNAEKWDGSLVETLPLPDGKGGTEPAPGLVPNSRGSIGDKRLEELDLDAVLCGVQVQSPGDTARRLVALWEMVSPDHENPEDALAEGWRLLAQHAVSGTIQAAGRFGPGTTNFVFEHPGLLELAGFEYEEATADEPGFVGAFTRRFESVRRRWEQAQQCQRAKHAVDYLESEDSKAPTKRQYVEIYQRIYAGKTEEDAKQAFAVAAEQEEVTLASGRLRLTTRQEKTS